MSVPPDRAARRYRKYVAANIRRQRKVLGLTQAELAEMVGVTPRTLQLIERAKQAPSFDGLVRIATALQVEPGDLFLAAEMEPPVPGRPRKT